MGELFTAAEPVTVVHVLNALEPAGVQVRTLELIEETQQQPIQHIIVTSTGRLGALAESYKRAGAILVPLSIHDRRFGKQFIRLLRRYAANTVVSNLRLKSGYVLWLSLLAGVPNRICYFRTDGISNSELSLKKRWTDNLLRFLVLISATQVHGVSPSTFTQLWPAPWSWLRRPIVKVNGIRRKAYLVSDASWLAESIGEQRASARIVLHLGRGDVALKNREKAITAFAAFANEHSDAELVFVGRDGTSEEHAAARLRAWKELAGQLGIERRVHFAGERRDIPNVLAAADVLLLTSTREGLPGVVLEATAAGIPVVASALPGVRLQAQSLPSVTVVDVAAADSVWASAIEDALAMDTSPSARQVRSATLDGTIYDADTNLEDRVAAWTRRPRRGAPRCHS